MILLLYLFIRMKHCLSLYSKTYVFIHSFIQTYAITLMPYFDVSVVIACEKRSGASFLDKSMKKYFYDSGCGHTKPAKISMGKSIFFVYWSIRLTRTTILYWSINLFSKAPSSSFLTSPP